MDKAVQVFVVINFLVIGLSHILAPRAWVAFFAWLRSKGEAGVFVVAFLCLWFGSLIVAFHPVWSGWPLMVTLLGWAQVLKGVIYFCFPAFGLKMIGRVTEENQRLFVYGGVASVGLATLLAWRLWGR